MHARATLSRAARGAPVSGSWSVIDRGFQCRRMASNGKRTKGIENPPGIRKLVQIRTIALHVR